MRIFYVYVYERMCERETHYTYGDQHYGIGDWIPFYVGKGKLSRDKCHLIAAENGDTSHKSNIIRKCWRTGTPLRVRRLRDGLTEEKSFRIEKNRVKRYGRICDGGPLVNKTLGGEGSEGLRHSKKSRRKMSKSHTGVPRSDEIKAKISAGHKGKVLSLETRAKFSAVRIGKPRPKTMIPKISGEHNGKSKITIKVAYRIRKLYSKGKSFNDIAAKLNVTYSIAYSVGTRKSWKHLPEKESNQ